MNNETKHTPLADISQIQWHDQFTMEVKFNEATFMGYDVVGNALLEACNNYERVKAERDELALRLKGAAERLHTAWLTTDDDVLADEWARYERHIIELLATMKVGKP